MISLSNITVSFAHLELLSDVSFSFNRKDRLALVGKNGAGKSTLLKIIAGLFEPTSGTVVHSEDLKIGYLPQQMAHARDKSVLEEALTVFAAIDNLKRETERITKELSLREDFDSAAYKKLMVDLTEATDRLHILSSDNPRGNAEKTLVGLGFKANELDRPTRTFSEGWNMRIELAKLLLSRPDVLLLDEPTNHLDLTSTQAIELALSTFPGAIVVVSHDEAFLQALHLTHQIEWRGGKWHCERT